MKKMGRLTCTALLLSLTVWARHYAVLPASGRLTLQVAAAADLGAPQPTEIEELVSALRARPGTQRATEQQVASVLQKLGKTLILGHTRGPEEVGIFPKAAQAVVVVVTNGGLGSGVLIRAVP